MVKKFLPFAWSLTAIVGLIGLTAALTPGRLELLEAHARDPDPKLALPALETQRQERPDDPQASLRLATAYEQAGRPKDAVWVIAQSGSRRALTDAERARVTHAALAAGQPATAIQVLAGPHEQLTPARRSELVDLALKGGALQEALHQQGFVAASNTPAALIRLRDIALMAGKQGAAIAAQRRLVVAQPSAEAGERLVELLLENADAAGALRAMERHVPGSGEAWALRAMELAEWAGNHARAGVHGQAAYEAVPDLKLGRRVAQHYAAVRDQRALRITGDLTVRWPEDAELRAMHRGLLATFGRYEELEALLRADAAAAPKDPEATQALVDHLLSRGNRAEAVSEMSRFTRRSPFARGLREKLARVLTWEGKMDEAREVFIGLHKDAPGNASDRGWREAWLGISTPVDDATRYGRENLRRLLAIDARQVGWRRRLANAEMENGYIDAAVREMRLVAVHKTSSLDDRLTYAEWLAWASRPADSLGVLTAELKRGGLPEPTLHVAVERAAAHRRWTDAARFLQALVVQKPRDVQSWEMLATAREAAGDVAGAAQAWHTRIGIDGGQAWQRIAEAGLHLRAGSPARAFSALGRRAANTSIQELRMRASLAYQLKRPNDEAATLRAMLGLKPSDSAIPLRLAEALDRAGDKPGAESALDQALAKRPDDLELLQGVAGRRAYGVDADQAAPLMAKLARHSDLGLDGLRLVADYYQNREPLRAAKALDSLHAKDKGNAGTWFRRAELARAASEGHADAAYRKAVSLGSTAADPDEREAAAMAYERLGQGRDAEATWRKLAQQFPARPSAQAALARLYLARGDTASAEEAVAALKRVAPAEAATHLLEGELLMASGRPEQAAAVLAGVAPADPEAPFAAAAEALARVSIGDYQRARTTARRALLARPADVGIFDTYRTAREAASERVGVRAFTESYGGLDRQKFFATGLKRWGDRLSMEVEAGRSSWAGGAHGVSEIGTHFVLDGGRWRMAARAAIAGPADPALVEAPMLMGKVTGGYRLGHWEFSATASQDRWEDLDLTAQRGGQERSVGAEATWQPDPRLLVRAGGGLGRLGLAGVEAGLSSRGLTELSLTPDPSGPWAARYQYTRRSWGEAGPKVGLPESLPFQAASLVWAKRIGIARVEVQPGALHDLSANRLAPSLAGSLNLDLGHDAEIAVSGSWGGRAANIGIEGTYQSVDATAKWHF